MGWLLLAAILFAVPASAQSEDTAAALARDAAALYAQAHQTADPAARARGMTEVVRRLDTLRARFPDSPLAAQIVLGRVEGIDVALARREAALALPTAAPVPDFDSASRPAAVKRERADLVETLRSAVVIVYVPLREGMSQGTGFFVSPTHLLTNAHVVESVDKVVVGNTSFGLRLAKVVARGKPRDRIGLDTAMLEVEDYRAPHVLPFTRQMNEGQMLAIAGYPGPAMHQDRAARRFFSSLAENKAPVAADIPSIRFDFGVLQGIFVKQNTGVENIQTGMTSSVGNSGSPYVNECGQVVGQEYAGSVAELPVRNGIASGMTTNFNWALSSRAILAFLATTPVRPVVADAVCR